MGSEDLYRRLTNIRSIVRLWMDAHPGQSLPEDINSNLVEAEDDYRRVTDAKNGSDR